MSADRLFVYGTLRKGSNNKFARLLFERAQFVGPARVFGRLYSFGRYPGARPEDGSIAGEMFRLDPASQLLTMLDDYEGPEFERAIATAHTTDGRATECWIYWYVGDSKGHLIESGDWLKR